MFLANVWPKAKGLNDITTTFCPQNNDIAPLSLGGIYQLQRINPASEI